LSARIGSIADNHKGSWYGYRAYKAALNMLMQTAAIELQHKSAQLRVVALQPGTVHSELSQPFSAGFTRLLEPAESVSGMLAALQNLQPRQDAHFIDYQGKEIPWSFTVTLRFC
jgi:NAD(P)-dependent dehydrogenase (short-subunit alcohol dehydrogenase family)